MAQVLFNDEGGITRKQWLAGTVVLVLAYTAVGLAASRWLGRSGLAEPLMVFISIAILIPFHSVNAKRFRATGRSPSLALWGGFVPALSVLAEVFLKARLVDMALGWMIIVVIVWYVIDLGFFPHEAHASADRIDAAAKRA